MKTSKKLAGRQVELPSQGVALTHRIIGYARVSTDKQTMDMQMAALTAAGVQDFFVETISATNAHRPEYNLMRKHLQLGDTLVVYAFSRLSRDVKTLLTIVDELEAEGIAIRSTSEPQIQPYTDSGRLMLTMIGAMDENEIKRTRSRTKDKMAQLKASGMYLGRPRKVALKDIPRMRAMRKRGVDVGVIAKKFNCSKPCVYSHTSNL